MTVENQASCSKPASPRVWAFTTYFCEGLPYSVIRSVSAVFFRDIGFSLPAIGLTSIFGLPWAIKFLWAPHLDQSGGKRRWLLAMQGLLTLFFLLAAVLVPLPWAGLLIGLLFFAASFFATTHDIAIDGYYLENLNNADQARFVGYRVMAYRIAMMAGAGVIATIGATVRWSLAFAGAGLTMALFFLYHRRCLPLDREATLPEAWLPAKGKTPIAEAFSSFLSQKKIGAILAFVLLARAGEYLLSAMTAPFMVDLGIKEHYGWITGGVGLPFSIAGATAGGWLIARYSLKRTIWPLLIAQNLTNLAYAALALALAALVANNTGNPAPTAIGAGNLVLVVCVHAFDQFAGGLGTAVLMIFLMRLCKPRFKATHYAIGTGLMAVSGLFAGTLSGFLAARTGYAWFFLLSFLLSLPGMAILSFLPLAETKKEASPTPATPL